MSRNRHSYRQLREHNQALETTLEFLQERVAELELEDIGWKRVLTGGGGNEPSADDRGRIRELSRMLAIKHALVKRGLAVQSHYVWAQGATFQALDPDINQVVQRFLDDPKNHVELTGAMARMQKDVELATDGNLFLVFFPNPANGHLRMRTIGCGEIEDVVCNPDDAKEPWLYKRVWTQRSLNATDPPLRKAAYYPDWRYRPRAKPQKINDIVVRWDTPVYHVKTGGFSDWKFGVSEIYAAIDWAQAYRSFLEDWATLTRAYATFAWKYTTTDGKRGVQAAQQRLGMTAGQSNAASLPGSTIAMSEGNNMEPIRTAGATTKMEDGRRIMLMVAAALNLPETFFGDVSVGTLATATSLDRPTELAMRTRQTLWANVFGAIINYQLLWAVKTAGGALRGKGKVVVDPIDRSETVVWNADVNAHIDIDFPPLVMMDPATRVTAITAAAPKIPSEKLVAKMLLSALGEDDIDELLDPFYDESGQLKDEYRRQPVLPGTTLPNLGGDNDTSQPETPPR